MPIFLDATPCFDRYTLSFENINLTSIVFRLRAGSIYLQDDLVGCLLLLWLIEDVDAPPGLVGRVWNIVPSPALVFI